MEQNLSYVFQYELNRLMKIAYRLLLTIHSNILHQFVLFNIFYLILDSSEKKKYSDILKCHLKTLNSDNRIYNSFFYVKVSAKIHVITENLTYVFNNTFTNYFAKYVRNIMLHILQCWHYLVNRCLPNFPREINYYYNFCESLNLKCIIQRQQSSCLK